MAGHASIDATTGRLRVVRGAVVGAVAATVGAGCHVLGGGMLPGPEALLAYLGACTMAAVGLSSIRWTPRRLAGALLLAQLGFHAALMAMMPGENHGSPAPMIACHVAASVIALVFLLYVEDAVHAMAERVVLRALRLVAATTQLLCPLWASATRSAVAHVVRGRDPVFTPVRGPPTPVW